MMVSNFSRYVARLTCFLLFKVIESSIFLMYVGGLYFWASKLNVTSLIALNRDRVSHSTSMLFKRVIYLVLLQRGWEHWSHTSEYGVFKFCLRILQSFAYSSASLSQTLCCNIVGHVTKSCVGSGGYDELREFLD